MGTNTGNPMIGDISRSVVVVTLALVAMLLLSAIAMTAFGQVNTSNTLVGGAVGVATGAVAAISVVIRHQVTDGDEPPKAGDAL